jgi:hypothetical protein
LECVVWTNELLMWHLHQSLGMCSLDQRTFDVASPPCQTRR